MRTVATRIVTLMAVLMVCHGPVHAHPDGEIGCRAQVIFGDNAVQQVLGELVLDEHHSRQALAPLQAAGQPQLDAASLQRLRAMLNQQFGRFNWLFRLKGDGQAQAIEPVGVPDTDIIQNRIVLKVHYKVTQPMAAKLWTLHCADPTYYWSTRFDPGINPEQGPAKSSASQAEQAQGHRNIVVTAI